jgi:hypothetical protein
VLAGGAVDLGNPSSRSLTSSRGIAIAGGQQFGVAYLLDGALHNTVYDGVNLPLPFPDAMQEFKVETGSQNAQNGYKAGGTVGIATKSGTNVFHGDLFEFARHHRFNATSPFAAINARTGKRSDDGLVRNQFGGVLGGPIVKDRIFFFGAYQGTRATQTPADIITFIPTAAMLAGDFSTVASAQCRAQGNLTLPAALGFANNRISPASFSPAAMKIARIADDIRSCGQIAYSRTTKPRGARHQSPRSIGGCRRATRCLRDIGYQPRSGSGVEEHPRQHPGGGRRQAGAGGATTRIRWRLAIPGLSPAPYQQCAAVNQSHACPARTPTCLG